MSPMVPVGLIHMFSLERYKHKETDNKTYRVKKNIQTINIKISLIIYYAY